MSGADKHQTITLKVIIRIADGLHIPGDRFGLTPRLWESGHSDTADIEGTTVRRRDFIQASTGAASTYIYSMVSSEPRAMHAALNKARRPLPQLDHFEKAAEALGVDVVMTTPTDLLDTALISFQKARTLTGQMYARS